MMFRVLQAVNLCVFMAICAPTFASTAGAEICVSATVAEPSMDAPVVGFPERCVEVYGVASEGIRSWADKAREALSWGGCNVSGSEQSFAMEFAWRYEIVADADPGGQAGARAFFSLEEYEYTQGAGQGTTIINDTVPDNVCLDGLVEIAVTAHAKTAAGVNAVPGPGQFAVLTAFLLAAWVFRDKIFPRATR